MSKIIKNYLKKRRYLSAKAKIVDQKYDEESVPTSCPSEVKKIKKKLKKKITK